MHIEASRRCSVVARGGVSLSCASAARTGLTGRGSDTRGDEAPDNGSSHRRRRVGRFNRPRRAPWRLGGGCCCRPVPALKRAGVSPPRPPTPVPDPSDEFDGRSDATSSQEGQSVDFCSSVPSTMGVTPTRRGTALGRDRLVVHRPAPTLRPPACTVLPADSLYGRASEAITDGERTVLSDHSLDVLIAGITATTQ
jgi:hypothetical protein